LPNKIELNEWGNMAANRHGLLQALLVAVSRTAQQEG
jgi:hypothetical protein